MMLAEGVQRDWQEALRLAQAGRVEAALACIDKALAGAPDHAALWADRGGMEQLAGLEDAAERSLRRALVLDAGQASAHHNLGLLLQSRGATAEALRHFEAAAAAEPDRAAFHASLGGARFALQDYAGAQDAYLAALARAPGDARTRYNLATALLKQFRFDAAEQELRRVTEDDPGFFEAWNNLGNVLNGLGRHEAALAAHVRAIELQPESAEAYANAGFDLRHIEHYDDAEQCYRKAIALQPDHAKAHFNLAVSRLLRGAFDEGFGEYVWREGRTSSSVPERGVLAGRWILLLRDQGIGDELFFLRFAPRLKAAGARLACLASPRLAPLLRRWPVLDTVTASAEAADVTIRLGDLPAFLREELSPAAFPAVPLVALPERRDKARRALAAIGPPPYVAVTWRAGTPLADQVGRSQRALDKQIDHAILARQLPQGTLLSIQRMPRPGETESLARAAGRPVADFSAWNEDLEDMLALLDCVDDYLAVSNTNVHLLAGLGRTATVFVPFPPEWRWMAAGDASPWFPGFRIIRQRADERWQGEPA